MMAVNFKGTQHTKELRMSDQPLRKHGRTQFYIEGEGFTPDAMPSPRLRAMAPAAVAAVEAAPPPVDEARAFRFCRLFPDLEKFQPDDAGLIALGQALADPFVPGQAIRRSPPGSPTWASLWTTTSRLTAPQGSPPARSIQRRSSQGGRLPWNSTACTVVARQSLLNCMKRMGCA